MNNQEPELNPKPDETDSAKTNESVQRERSELPPDQQSSLPLGCSFANSPMACLALNVHPREVAALIKEAAQHAVP